MSSITQTLSPQDITILFPDAIYLEIPAKYLQIDSSSNYSNLTGKHNAFLNEICLEVCLEWVQSLSLEDRPTVFPNHLPSLWESVNGSVIVLGDTRIALIPSDEFGDVTIPAEWVDIPNWSADYYIPVHIDLEARQVCLWGYIPHDKLKAAAEYDRIYRNYSVDRSALISDLNILWTARELQLNERAELSIQLEPIPTQAIEQLSQPSPYSPRLDLKFEQWATLISSESDRQQLYNQRLAKATAVQSKSATITSSVTNLSLWLQQNFDRALEAGWQTLDTLLTPETSYSFVRSSRSSATIQLAKLVNLKFQLEATLLILSIALTPNENDEVSVLVRVYPQTGVPHLSSGLIISLMDDATLLQNVTSRDDDEYIQLRTFHCTASTAFALKLELDGVSITEDFTIGDIPGS
jgi:Protein of unknown function (DUF1822)